MILYTGSWLIGEGKRFIQNKIVFEMGCGSTGLPGICSLAGGAEVVYFLDTDTEAMTELTENISCNMSSINSHRLIQSFGPLHFDNCVRLITGDWNAICIDQSPICCDMAASSHRVVIASEIVYGQTPVEEIAKCIDSLLSGSGGGANDDDDGCSDSCCFILCQSALGRVGIDDFLTLMSSEQYFYNCESMAYRGSHAEEEAEYPLVFYVFSRSRRRS